MIRRIKLLEVSNRAKWQKFGISMLTQPCFPWAIDITTKNLCLNYCVAPPPSAAGGFDTYDKPVALQDHGFFAGLINHNPGQNIKM